MSSVCRRIRIVDCFAQIGEVPASFGCSRHAIIRSPSHVRPLALIVSEGEDFVLPDWTTDRAAELVPVTARHAAFALRKRIAGKIGVRAFKVKSGAMDFVGTGFG